MELIFPSDSVIVVAGVPGAGKTTLLRRAVDRHDATVVDTDDRTRRGPLLYLGHYARIAAAIAGTKPAVIHSRGTSSIARRTILTLARLRGRPAHIVLMHADRDTPRPASAPAAAPSARRDGPPGRRLAGAAGRGRPARGGLGDGRVPHREQAATVTALRFAPAYAPAASARA